MNTMSKCAVNETTVRNLMYALEMLERKADTLADLATFSDNVINKFNDPRPHPSESCGNDKTVCTGDINKVDLIGLFYLVADRIDTSTQHIGKNIESINSIIG
jgi:hypothetical protein